MEVFLDANVPAKENGDNPLEDRWYQKLISGCLHGDSLISMSDGSLKKIKDIKIGDKVVSYNETRRTTPINKVTNFWNQGIKPVYEIKFRDGTSTRCGLEHIWWVYPQKTGSKPRQMTTKDLIEKGLTFKSGQYKYRIPLTEPVEFPSKVTEFDPYLIGVLIADARRIRKRQSLGE